MLAWSWLGRADYRRVLADQLALRERVWAGGEGAVYLCEHPPVITLGRSANIANVLAAGDVPVVQIERGGDVTYHGPGQLMIYPIVRLRAGVVDFLSRISAAIAEACAVFGVAGAEFRRDPAGVWLGDRKLAACGIHIGRGVSVHGFALNIATPHDAWLRIRPCGLSVPQVSLADVLAERQVTVEQVAAELGPRLVRALL
ncbi:MAG: octanoyltransferase [Myxococcales bacterium]|nr:octanoyltransferase [Myxococcales bacterium]